MGKWLPEKYSLKRPENVCKLSLGPGRMEMSLENMKLKWKVKANMKLLTLKTKQLPERIKILFLVTREEETRTENT